LNDSQARADFETIRQRYISLRATEDRLLAEQAGLPAIVFHADVQEERGDPLIAQHMVSQEQLFLSRKQALRSELASLEEAEQSQRDAIRGYGEQLESRRRQSAFLREELVGMREMVKEGYAPRNKLLELERMAAELDATASDLRSNLARAQRAIAEIAIRKQQRTQQFGKDIDLELAQLRRDVSADAERFRAAREALGRNEIRAPVSGSVIGIANQTVGGVLTPGARIMDIVPRDEQLMLEAKIPPHLIDRIRVEQEADIRFSNFSNSPQLVVEGKLVSLSADLLADPAGGGYYLARIAVTPKGVEALAQHRLQPGMPAEIIIKTGERSLLTYLLHPLTRRLVQAMKEE
jgi:protease secretion system membrane fusion protein